MRLERTRRFQIEPRKQGDFNVIETDVELDGHVSLSLLGDPRAFHGKNQFRLKNKPLIGVVYEIRTSDKSGKGFRLVIAESSRLRPAFNPSDMRS